MTHKKRSLGQWACVNRGPLLHHSYGPVWHFPACIISCTLFPIMYGLLWFAIHLFCHSFVSHKVSVVPDKISSFIHPCIHPLFFSIANNIYVKDFFWSGGSCHSFRISLVTLSFFQCLSFFLEYSISFIHFTHSLNSFIWGFFLGGRGSGGVYRFFEGNAVGGCPLVF